MLERAAGTIKLPVSFFDWVAKFGDDFGYLPLVDADAPNDAIPSSMDRIDIMRRRMRKGMPLFSKSDTIFFDGSRSEQFDAYATDPTWTTWDGNEDRGIEKSVDGRYEYRKWEIWDKSKPVACFIGLFPDPSIDLRKEMMLAMSHGCGGFQRVNLFAKRLGRVDELWNDEDPIGDWNDRVIRLTCLSTSFTVLCWGKAGRFVGRSAYVVSGIKNTLKVDRVFWYGATSPSYLSENGTGNRFVQPIGLKDVEFGAPLHNIRFKYLESLDND